MRTHARAIVCALLVLGTACRSRPGPDGGAPGADAPGPSSITVVNDSNHGVRFYLIRGNQRHRLGLVPAGSRAQYELPARLIDREVSFLADPVGFTRTQRSDLVYVRPGQQVRMTLEKELRSHSLTVH